MSKTDISLYFANPSKPDHKKYEVLRALFYEKLPKKEVTEKFGYTNYTVQAIIRDFRQGKLIFFPQKKHGPKEYLKTRVSRNCHAEQIRRGV